jgi:hypothetical protein
MDRNSVVQKSGRLEEILYTIDQIIPYNICKLDMNKIQSMISKIQKSRQIKGLSDKNLLCILLSSLGSNS